MQIFVQQAAKSGIQRRYKAMKLGPKFGLNHALLFLAILLLLVLLLLCCFLFLYGLKYKPLILA